VRRGVTLLELLVVLVVMGIAAAVVAPALVRPVARPAGASGSVESLVADARRTAIRRGQPVRLRLAADGVWALVAASDGAFLASGRAARTGSLDRQDIDLRIDAMGSCTPAGGLDVRLHRDDRAFDPLACRARPVGP
jgi:prepilin-type N-terminal cleavage/methylation domain-containing protein